MIKLTGLIASLTLACNILHAQLNPIDQGTSIQFKVRNFGIDVYGSFTGLVGNIQFASHYPTKTSFNVSVDANTVNTENKMRDEHLRNETYFDVTNFPYMHFVSNKVEQIDKNGTLTVFGSLQIKNHTKDISFPFTVTPSAEGYKFEGEFDINRKDFGIGGSSIISDSVRIYLNILAR